ncbi:hypothetical protein P3S67_021538 [Capsicum chacoense]
MEQRKSSGIGVQEEYLTFGQDGKWQWLVVCAAEPFSLTIWTVCLEIIKGPLQHIQYKIANVHVCLLQMLKYNSGSVKDITKFLQLKRRNYYCKGAPENSIQGGVLHKFVHRIIL